MTLVLCKKHRVSLIILSGVVSVLCMLLLTPKASAATLNVVAGNDGIAENNQCQLSEAITNINNQAQTHDDCLAGNSNNDTINLPTGTITLTADLPVINKTANISGQGMDTSIINGNSGQYEVLRVNLPSAGIFNISGITVTAFKNVGMLVDSIPPIVDEVSVNITDIEIDGTNSNNAVDNALSGILLGIWGSAIFNNVNIHDLSSNDANNVMGLMINAVQGSVANININKATITDIQNNGVAVGIGFSTGIVDFSFTPGTISASVTNSTIANISGSQLIMGISALATINNGETNITVNAHNNTITDVSGSGELAGIGINGISVGATDVSNAAFGVTNNIITDIESNHSCNLVGDVSSIFGQPPSAGTINQSITSNGGNITDDASCNNYFNQPTDKNEVPNLSSFFSILTNNGGTIPTIKPLPGNIAIDGGICTDQTPDTDARGITRPQGQTCDSGAYEVEQASHDTNQSTSPKQTKLITPAGVINKSFTTVSTDGLPKDNADVNYQYPLGLSTFTLEVPSGSTQAVSLFYETSLKAKQLVPRKYKTTNKIFSNIPNAQLSDVVIDGKTGVQLTYNITDGGELDQDGQVNGIIIDPVGLAQEDPSLLTNTGDFILVAIPIGTALIIATVIVTYVDYRKHKKPLLDINRDLAKSYTYWHHLKTVTIPLFSYRLSFAFEKKSNHLNISRF